MAVSFMGWGVAVRPGRLFLRAVAVDKESYRPAAARNPEGSLRLSGGIAVL